MTREDQDREMARVTCDTCGVAFDTQQELDEHNRSQHAAGSGGMPSQEATGRPG